MIALSFAMIPPPGREIEVRSHFEANPVPLFVLDPERRIRNANPAALRVLAPEQTTLEGRSFDELFSGASRASLESLFSLLGSSGAPAHRVAVEALGVEGRPFPAELVVFRLPAAASGGFGAVLRDLREAPANRVPAPVVSVGSYSVAELLLANRLRDLV
jgi:PAS domain S-box-containing protein